MAEIRVNPTRMELKKLQTRYRTARRGHKLLKDKRDELMRRFLDVVRRDKELRVRVEEALQRAFASFALASAVSNPRMLEEALMLPRHEGELSVSYRNQMSVTVPDFSWQEMPQAAATAIITAWRSPRGSLTARFWSLARSARICSALHSWKRKRSC